MLSKTMRKPLNCTARRLNWSNSSIYSALIRRAQESGADDPDILFLYGKALFQVAQKNSQVLGGAPANDPSFGNVKTNAS
jgi:hypothetical protein